MKYLLKVGQVAFTVLFALSITLQGIQPAAAQNDGVRIARNPHTGKVSFIGAAPGKPISVHAAQAPGMAVRERALGMAQAYAVDFGLKDPARELKEKKTENLKGRHVTKFQQIYQDIPVMAGELVVDATDQGGLISMNGEISPDLSLNTKPTVTADTARQAALQSVATWYQADAADLEASQPTLWIYDSRLLEPDGTPPILVWRMDVYGSNGLLPLNELVLVDAHSGKSALHFSQTGTAAAPRPPARQQAEEPLITSKITTQDPATSADAPMEDPSDAADMVLSAKKPTTEVPPVTLPTQMPVGASAAAAPAADTVGTLSGTVRYVSPTGTDSGDCVDSAAPCQSILFAIVSASAGDTVRVAGGTYTPREDRDHVVWINKSLVLSGGWNGSFTIQNDVSIIEGQNRRLGILIESPATVDRFVVQHGVGGIKVQSGASATISNSTIRDNQGTGIIVYASATMLNTTITGNVGKGGYFGGGVYVYSGSATLVNSTIADNTSESGGGLYNEHGTITMSNTIVANNSAPTGPDCHGAITSTGHNIVGSPLGCNISSVLSDHLGVDPKIGTGPVGRAGYYALQPDSIAVDSGDALLCPPADQRGMSRPQGNACDIGAYEYVVPGAVTAIGLSTGAGQRAAPLTTFVRPLQVYAVDSAGSAVPGVLVTFLAPTAGPTGVFSGSASEVTLVSGAAGIASTTLTANGQVGDYTVTATASGIPASVEFALRNAYLLVDPARPDDASDCATPATACRSLSGAVGKALPGDVIRVAAGTDMYWGQIKIVKDLSISGGWNSDYTEQTGRTVISHDISVLSGATVTIADLALQDAGPGIGNSGNLTLRNVSIIHSGGIQQGGGSLLLENVTISHNSASSNGFSNGGGGIDVWAGNVLIKNSTITQNVSSDLGLVDPSIGGGIANSDAGRVTIINTIIAGNEAESGPDCSGRITLVGHNLIGWSDGCTLLGPGGAKYDPALNSGNQVGVPGAPVNAMLGNLADNGGRASTHALLPGSPAIDAGDPLYCLGTDERGVSRPQGAACDLGAFEGAIAQPVAPVIWSYGNGNWGCGETLPCGFPPHDNSLLAYGFYLDRFGRRGIDGNNGPVVSSLLTGPGHDEVLWNGAEMFFGDAHGWDHADDVVAELMTFGVLQYTSGLFPYYQSGAIQMSLADTFAELFDQSNGAGTDTAAVRWLFGEDIAGLGAIRSLSEPPLYGQPDKMTSSLYFTRSMDYRSPGDDDSGGVHTNSGVGNKAAFLITDGGSFNGETIAGLGPDKALAIYMEVNTHLLTAGADYADLYDDLYQACLNLIGGPEGISIGDCQSVQAALDAVEMNAQPGATPAYNPEAPLCAAGSTPVDLFYDDMESGMGNWVASEELRWKYDSPYGVFAHSGTHSLYADGGGPQSPITASVSLRSGVTLPAGAFLWFEHAYDFEFYDGYAQRYDGGVLEYTTNGGATWKDARPLMDANGYNGIIYPSSGNARKDNPLHGRRAFVATSHGYTSTRLNLSTLAGNTINFRWRMGQDWIGPSVGWWLDDVRIYTCSSFGKVAPSDRAIDQDLALTLSWTPVADAISYEYCYSASMDNACSGWINVGTATSVDLPLLSIDRIYYWQVRANRAAGPLYADERWWKFTTAPIPGALSKSGPPDGAASQLSTLNLSWSASNAAKSYEYCYGVTPEACTDWIDAGNVTSVHPDGMQPFTTYYWQVRAVNQSGVTYADGDPADHHSFATGAFPAGAFGKSAPAKAATMQSINPTLTWTPSRFATSYKYCYDTSNDNLCKNWIDNGTSTSVTLAGLKPATKYFWQVQAIAVPPASNSYADGNAKAFWSFTTLGAPAGFGKLKPLNGALKLTASPTLTWAASKNATSYQYCYDTIKNNVCDGTWVTTTALSAAISGLSYNTTYYWQVQAVNELKTVPANSGGWWKFTVQYSPPDLVAPVEGAELTELKPTFSWNSVPGATGYSINISSSSSFATALVKASIASPRTAYTPTVNLPAGVALYWRVRATGLNGPSAWSTVRTLIIQ